MMNARLVLGHFALMEGTVVREIIMNRRHLQKWFFLILAFCVGMSPAFVEAQRTRRSSGPEEIKLTTKDGVKLKGTYYASSLGRDAVPVVMLHDFKESRRVFGGLATALQDPSDSDRDSRAVITIDLRGHGESTTQVSRDGRSRDLEASRLKPGDFQDMVLQDMEAVRKFLVEKNDAGELNLNKLCLVGSGMGANVATYWAAADWSAPLLATRKQGQDVKALVLASPEWGFRGLPLLKPLRHADVRQRLSFFIVYGEHDSKARKDAKVVHKNLAKYHPEPSPDKIREQKDLFVFPLRTKLQGTRLLTDPDFGMLSKLDAFIDARLTQKNFDWIKRRQ